MTKIIIFSILIAIVISSFTLDLSFVLDGIAIIANSIAGIPEFFLLIIDILTAILTAPTIRIIVLFGLGFIVIKWLISLVGDNDEEHTYKRK